MVLTRVSPGQPGKPPLFTGKTGDTATLRIESRDATAPTKTISVTYDATNPPIANDGSFKVKVVSGETPLVIVYAATEEGAWVDLMEIDGTGKEKKMSRVFDPGFPVMALRIEGQP